jgi:hypothetical protein
VEHPGGFLSSLVRSSVDNALRETSRPEIVEPLDFDDDDS